MLVRSTIRATQQGDFVSIPASNKAIQIMAVDVHDICNGKVVQTGTWKIG